MNHQPIALRAIQWRRSSLLQFGKSLTVALIAIALSGCMGYVPGRQAYWDAKVKEMCDKEGGITVFHKVRLPDSEYRKLLNDRNQIDLPHEDKARPDQAYVYSIDTETIVRGSMKVRKHVTQVVRKADNTVLSQQVGFSRVGGDLPTIISHPTYFGCPRVPAEENLFEQTFERLL